MSTAILPILGLGIHTQAEHNNASAPLPPPPRSAPPRDAGRAATARWRQARLTAQREAGLEEALRMLRDSHVERQAPSIHHARLAGLPPHSRTPPHTHTPPLYTCYWGSSGQAAGCRHTTYLEMDAQTWCVSAAKPFPREGRPGNCNQPRSRGHAPARTPGMRNAARCAASRQIPRRTRLGDSRPAQRGGQGQTHLSVGACGASTSLVCARVTLCPAVCTQNMVRSAHATILY